MTQRSLTYLAEPTLVAVGLAHFIVEPSMLTMYKEHGVNVKRL
jgi:hypothetical protein